MRILVIGALPSLLVKFRGPLLKAMLAGGHKVFAASNGRDADTEAKLGTLGVEYCPIRIARAGINPLVDLGTLLDLIRLIRRVKPDIVLSYMIKPVIYGGLAARFYRVQNAFSLIEGLGRVFMPWESFTHMISSIAAKGMYRIGLRGSTRVFFLNPDDLNQFVKEGYVPAQNAVLLNGIGIDLAYYAKEPLPDSSRCRFLMIARLLKDKGVREYVAAAKIVRARHRHVDFVLAGDLDENPSSIKQAELDAWRRDGLIDCVGYRDDVRPLIRDCHVYILPSYREGTPRTVLEAMATGRAVVTTDAPGCRETVFRKDGAEDGRQTAGGGKWTPSPDGTPETIKIGRNGILVPVKDVEALAAAMEFFIQNPDQAIAMGRESRRYAEERYDVHNVNATIMKEMGLEK